MDPLDPRAAELRAKAARAVAHEQVAYKACLACKPVDYQRLRHEHRLAFEAMKSALRDYWRATHGPDAPFPMEAQSWDQRVEPTVPSQERKIIIA